MMIWPDLQTLRADPSRIASLVRAFVERHPCCSSTAVPRPGTASALAVRGRVGVLYLLEVDSDKGGQIPLVGDAARAAETARRLVRYDLGGLRPDMLPAPLVTSARQIIDPRGEPPLPLDGPSLGLPIALALVSAFLDLPLPPQVIATAQLDATGALYPVDGLEEKLAVLRAWAPRVTQVLVAQDQREPTDRLGLEMVRVGTLAAALRTLWPELDAQGMVRHVLGRCPTEHRPQLARRLFQISVYGAPHVLDWGIVSLLAQNLARELEGRDAWHAQVAAAVAARHDNQSEPALPPLDPDLSPASLRLVLLAHQVQDQADRAPAHGTEVAEVALAAARQHAGTPESARLLGALGRLAAAWGALDEARQRLAEAVAGWTALYQEHQASHALCEWLRLEGASGATAAVLDLVRGPAQGVLDHPDTDEASRAFLCLAIGRALVQSGQGAQGLSWLRPSPMEVDHARAARLRWRIAVREDDDDRRALDALPPELQQEVRALLRLEHGEQEALAALDAAEVERMLGWCPPDVARAAHVARWWRY